MTRFNITDRVIDSQGNHTGNIYTANDELPVILFNGLKKPSEDVKGGEHN